ncbi:major facilitator superfamily domain-containing protein [Boeremia exigua]|uniref:major facilitator superfamily domain-containing protein n=1 Tax=Boeremia exigua TaxID=749465 RepID=UPI001E8CAD2B|nr:major facilitator superfamily domain-containing protein [Boeremia exigua]KAH6642984.1 major facilitator superfamily domain-containing protein [Boeremia exigua]
MVRPGWLASLTHHSEKPPAWLKFRSSDGFIIGTVSLAVFTDMFLYGIIVPVIPFALQSRSHVEKDRVQYWVSVLVAIYGASLFAFSPICGWLADRGASRRSPLLLGLIALLGSTVLLQVGNTTGILVAGRVLQGASAAVVWVIGLALLADTIPQENLAQAMGYVSLGMSLGTLVSPLLGGIVFDRVGYDAVFGMAYGLIGLDIVLRLLLVEKKVAARWEPVADVQAKAAAGSPAIRPTCAQDDATDTEKGVLSGQSGTSAPIGGKHLRDRRRDRLPPVLALLYSRRLLAALFCALIQAALLTSFDSVLTIHAANLFGWTATGAALLFLPLVIPTFLAPAFGWICDKYGGRFPCALGFSGACAPLVCLRFVDENTLNDKVILCALLALTGLCLAPTFPSIMAEITFIVEAKEKSSLASGRAGFGQGGAYAQAYGLFNMAFAAGCTVGPLLAGFIVEDRGWSVMALVLGILSAVTAVPPCLWLGGWIAGKSRVK